MHMGSIPFLSVNLQLNCLREWFVSERISASCHSNTLVIVPLNNEKVSYFVLNAPRFPTDHSVFEGSHPWPVCPSDKSSM